MAFQDLNVNHRMQRTATLSRQVLERAKKRKVYWYLPSHYQSKTFREDDVSLEAAFAAVAEHLACISAVCENYYCSVPPFHFEENEIEHIFRYHSREASKNLLRAFENEEKQNAPAVGKQNAPAVGKQNAPAVGKQNAPAVGKQNAPAVGKQNAPAVGKQNAPAVGKPECHKTEPTPLTKPTALIPAQPSVSEEIIIEVSPGSYIINTSSYDDTVKEAHLVNVQSGKSVNLVFHLPPPNDVN